MPNSPFSLDPQLDQDCLFVKDLGLCRLLLLNDSRWPWLVLVPRIACLEELHDLEPGHLSELTGEIRQVSRGLKKLTSCEKINVGALGNMVRQLHIHVIARNEGDGNWPGPVWGFGDKQLYTASEQEQMIEDLKGILE